MSALLEVKGLQASYGQNRVLQGIDLRVGEHESVGLLGPNGHGKTTLLRTISGLHRTDAGATSLRGESITQLSSHQIVARGVIHVAQANPLFPACTIAEHLHLGARARVHRGDEQEQLERVFTLFPKLHERRAQDCGTLSGGERQMLAVAVGLMASPELLMLDEPTLGLAPKVRWELREAIQQIRASGTALIVVDGDVEFMLDLTDRLYGIELGKVAYEADSTAGIDRAEVVAMYFSKEGTVDVT